MPGLSEPGFAELVIVGLTLAICLGHFAARIARLRRKLAAEVRPTVWTWVNGLGVYLVVGPLLLIGGIAMLLENAQDAGAPPPGTPVGARPPAIASAPPHPLSNWQTLTIDSGLARIRVPPGWERSEAGEQAEMLLVAASSAEQLLLSVTRIPRVDVAASTLTAFVDHLQGRLPQSFEITGRREITTGARPAIEVRAEDIDAGLRYDHLTRVTSSGDAYWIVEVRATVSRFAAHEETLRRICDSFTVD